MMQRGLLRWGDQLGCDQSRPRSNFESNKYGIRNPVNILQYILLWDLKVPVRPNYP
jgi:hypothetical protein